MEMSEPVRDGHLFRRRLDAWSSLKREIPGDILATGIRQAIEIRLPTWFQENQYSPRGFDFIPTFQHFSLGAG